MVPAAGTPCVRCRACRPMKVLRPMKTMERATTASDSFTNEPTSSTPRAGEAVVEVRFSPIMRSTGTHKAAPASAGSTSSGVARSEPCPIATKIGARAKPMLPRGRSA